MDLCCIRALRAEEYGRLKEFLYEAIFLPDGAQPLPREVTDDPSLRIYWEGFGREPDDRALCAEAKGQIIGAIWCRMLPEGFGHADKADAGAGSGGSCGLQGARDRESIDRADARGAAGGRICAGLAGRAAGQPGTSALSPVRIRSHPGDSRRVHHGQIAAVESTASKTHAQQPEALHTGRPVNSRLQNRSRQQTSTQRHEPPGFPGLSSTIGKEIATGVCRGNPTTARATHNLITA